MHHSCYIGHNTNNTYSAKISSSYLVVNCQRFLHKNNYPFLHKSNPLLHKSMQPVFAQVHATRFCTSRCNPFLHKFMQPVFAQVQHILSKSNPFLHKSYPFLHKFNPFCTSPTHFAEVQPIFTLQFTFNFISTVLAKSRHGSLEFALCLLQVWIKSSSKGFYNWYKLY